MKLYMFRAVRLSFIRSLFIVHSAMVYVIQVCRQLSHNLLQTNPCIRHNFSTQVFRKRVAQLHYVGPELRYIFWPFLASFGGQKRPEAKRWSHWTCSSLGTIFQPMRIKSVPDVKCFCNNKNVLRAQSMVWHFVRQPVVVFFTAQYRALASSSWRFLDHTQRRATVGRTPLDEWSIRRRDLYLITHNTTQQTSMPPVGFEHTISAGERPKTYALDRAATGTGSISLVP